MSKRYKSGWKGGPISKYFPERNAAQMVRDGILRLDPDGSVWRLQKVFYTPEGVRTEVPQKPRRIDYGPSGEHRSFKITIGYRRLITVGVARFVWQVHHGDIPEGLTVNHKDGKPDHNDPKNFELMTHSQQHKHRYAVLGHVAGPKIHKRLTKRFAEAARVALDTGELGPLRDVLKAYDERPFKSMARYAEAKAEREGRA